MIDILAIHSDSQLPLHPDAPVENLPGEISPVAISLVQSAPARVLVVDDNEDNRALLTRRLEKQNHIVEPAEDGDEALEKLRAAPFDLVLLDIMMPGIDGYEVLRQLKADEALRHIPVIMISALGELESVVRCIEMGAEDYLPKPFSPTILKARINACLEKKRARDREVELFAQVQENFARLRRLEQQRDDMTHMIVHDLRSPLSANLAGLELIDMLGPLTKEQKECLSIALRSGQNLLGLINDLLDISKIEAGALRLELHMVDAAQLIKLAVDQIAPLFVEKKLLVTQDISPALPHLLGDESKLQRVLVNLLSNAVKFTPRNGEIVVGAHLQTESGAQVEADSQANAQSNVIFSVLDNGEGIAPEATAHIFEKFVQAEDRRAGRQNSTGLGLTFCKLAVEAHGGRIWVESTPGVGSAFSFSIPVPVQNPPNAAASGNA